MMPDFPLGETLDFKFTTRQFSSGAPFLLAGSPAVEVYEDNSTAQITAGETITPNFDGVAGLNNLRIVATGGNGYQVGSSYTAILSNGTVDGVDVTGEVVAQFTIERSASLAAVAALNDAPAVSAAAIVDEWESQSQSDPTGFHINLQEWKGVVPNNLLSNRVDSDVGFMAANVITAVSITDAAFLAAKFAANSLDGKGDWNINKTGYTLTVTPPTAAQITDDWESQSQADPTGFHVNIQEWLGGIMDALVNGSVPASVQDWGGVAPNSLISGRVDSDMGAIATSGAAAIQLALGANTIENGVFEGTPTTTLLPTDLTETDPDIYVGRIVLITGGAARGEATDITDYAANGDLTVIQLANAPASSDPFIII